MDTAADSLRDQFDELKLGGPAMVTLGSSLPTVDAFSSFPSLIRSPFQLPAAVSTTSMSLSNGGIDIPGFSRRSPWGGSYPNGSASLAAFMPDVPSSLDSIAPIAQQTATTATTTFRKSQLYEKKLRHIEQMRAQRRQLEVDMKMFDLQQEREQLELEQLARDLARAQQHPLDSSLPKDHQGRSVMAYPRQLPQQLQQSNSLTSSGSSAFSSTSASALSSEHIFSR
ncbi:hypothetical protein KEM52_002579, partial [Ascosphaera acerosa]